MNGHLNDQSPVVALFAAERMCVTSRQRKATIGPSVYAGTAGTRRGNTV